MGSTVAYIGNCSTRPDRTRRRSLEACSGTRAERDLWLCSLLSTRANDERSRYRGDEGVEAHASARGVRIDVRRLPGEMAVNVVEVGAAPAAVDRDVDLLVVGGPTHAFGMSRPTTRDDALSKSEGAGVLSKGDGLREWLDAVHMELDVPAVAFDTRINKPRVPGSAAHAAQRRLRHIGCTTVAPAESFYVHGTKGPLVDGEVDRAQQWGRQLLAKLPHPQPDTSAN